MLENRSLKKYIIALAILAVISVAGFYIPMEKVKPLEGFWRETFDRYPYLPSMAIITFTWALACAVFTIVYQSIKARSFVILILLPALPMGYYMEPFVAFVAFGSALGWLVIDSIVLIVKTIKKTRDEKIGRASFYADIAALLLCIGFFAYFNHLDSQPEYLVNKIATRTPVIEIKLHKMGRKAFPALHKGLSSQNTKTAATCARLLRKTGGEIDQFALYPLLKRTDKSETENPRMEAVKTLGSKGGVNTLDHLLKTAFNNLIFVFKEGKAKLNFNRPFYNQTLRAIRSIEERTNNYTAADMAYKYSQQTDDHFEKSAWGLIGVELGGTQSMESLSVVFDRIYKNGQMMILNSLNGAEAPEAMNLLFRALKNQSIMVRRKAIALTKQRREIIAIYKLIKMLDDPIVKVRHDANQALKAITGEDFGFDPDGKKPQRQQAKMKWLLWWAKKARE